MWKGFSTPFQKGRKQSERRSRPHFQTGWSGTFRHASHEPVVGFLLHMWKGSSTSDFYFAYLDTSMTTNKRAILVRLPESLVDRLDAVAYDLHMRFPPDYIRRSLERALDFSEAHEVPLMNDPAIKR